MVSMIHTKKAVRELENTRQRVFASACTIENVCAAECVHDSERVRELAHDVCASSLTIACARARDVCASARCVRERAHDRCSKERGAEKGRIRGKAGAQKKRLFEGQRQRQHLEEDKALA
eukprot:1905657-Rhodomonas_salina.1